MASELNLGELAKQLRLLADQGSADMVKDDALRRQLRDAARDVSCTMEVGGDAVHRMGSLPLQLAMARIGVELDIFGKLNQKEPKTWSSRTMAEACGADPALMTRMMRYYASFRMVREVGPDQFEANNISYALSPEGPQSDINYFFEMISPAYMYFPEFLRKNNWQATYDPNNTPWQTGWKTHMAPFQWLHAHPEHMAYFLPWMTAQRFGMQTWLDAIPFEKQHGSNTSAETVLFVDLGGAMGHQSIALRKKFAKLPGRVILQDLPQVISNVPELPGVEKMEHDFWTPQTVRGARVYYMRNILHDWPDDKCKLILENTRSAMTKESVILVDEMIIPREKAEWRATQLDITLMTCLAAQERTLDQFKALFTSAGLQLQSVTEYTKELGDSILAAVPL